MAGHRWTHKDACLALAATNRKSNIYTTSAGFPRYSKTHRGCLHVGSMCTYLCCVCTYAHLHGVGGCVETALLIWVHLPKKNLEGKPSVMKSCLGGPSSTICIQQIKNRLAIGLPGCRPGTPKVCTGLAGSSPLEYFLGKAPCGPGSHLTL